MEVDGNKKVDGYKDIKGNEANDGILI